MIDFIVNRIIKRKISMCGCDDRKIYGTVCAVLSITLNLLLFFVKLAVGSIAGSTSVTVDAFHNLTDTGSGAVMLISFLLPEKNRSVKENIAGLIIGAVLIFAGSELAEASIVNISSPHSVQFSVLSVFLLIFSVMVKICMFLFNRKCGKEFDSSSLRAASLDCLCDILTTLVTVATGLLSEVCTANIDAYGGLAVSVFIFATGIKTIAEGTKAIVDELTKQ